MKRKINIYSKIPASADIKIEPFDTDKRHTKPHRHDKYLELVYFSKGTGQHFMDQTKYTIEPPVFFVIKKNQVHHWQIDTVPEGYVIIVKESFLDNTLDRHLNLQLRKLGDHQVILPETDTGVDALFKIASVEMRNDPQRLKVAIEGILKALLSKILGHTDVQYRSNSGNLSSRFDEPLQQRLKNDVSHYADLLHCTPQNLSAHCKKEYSKTASEYIAAHIVKEAKRLLRYTDVSVTEIAHAFEFKDVSHFVKYFKRHEGKTPLQFKKTAAIP